VHRSEDSVRVCKNCTGGRVLHENSKLQNSNEFENGINGTGSDSGEDERLDITPLPLDYNHITHRK
jgi:hypothetical protein